MGKTSGGSLVQPFAHSRPPQLGLLMAILKGVLAICKEGDYAAFVTACSGAWPLHCFKKQTLPNFFRLRCNKFVAFSPNHCALSGRFCPSLLCLPRE